MSKTGKRKAVNLKALAIKTAGAFLLIGVIAFFLLRSYFLQKAIDRAAKKLKREYKVELKVEQASFESFAVIDLRNISLVPENGDTLLSVNHFSAGVSLWYALFGDLRLKAINTSNGYLQVINKDGQKNYANFFRGKVSDSLESSESKQEENNIEKNYAKIAYKLITRMLNHVPRSLVVENFRIKGIDDDRFFTFNISKLSLADKIFNAAINVTSNSVNQNWDINGFANLSDHTAKLNFSSKDSGKVMIPYVFEKLNLKAGFDSVKFELEQLNFEDDQLKIQGLVSVDQLLINHPKISKSDVLIDHVEFHYSYLLGKDFVSLDSTSTVKFNKVDFYPFVKFQNRPDTIYYLSISTAKTRSQDFIESLPEGLFAHLKGMEMDGSFAYRLDFIYDENHPDDMKFESVLKKDNFKIIKYGEANLGKLNTEFIYVPMENGRPQRNVFIGAKNPFYTPLDRISLYLKKTVLTTEDPSFYYHRGFVTEAFRQSIVKNIRSGKFKRGASTISMQLVKNVFLTREKTVARKLEEILLVYILENNNIVSKDRMFEVYLNIIEWGPNIYGIGEASQFYFRKKPADLNLSESMFLATIIPRPKGFMWRFDKDGTPKPYLEKTYKFLGNLMLRRNLIVPQDTLGLTHLVKISGPARKFIHRNDSLLNDTIIEKELQMIAHPEERPEE